MKEEPPDSGREQSTTPEGNQKELDFRDHKTIRDVRLWQEQEMQQTATEDNDNHSEEDNGEEQEEDDDDR